MSHDMMIVKSGDNSRGCTSQWMDDQANPKAVIITSFALVIITAVAAYYCISSGLKYLDTSSSLQKIGGGLLVYSGAVFSLFGIVQFARGVRSARKHPDLNNRDFMFFNYFTLLAPLSIPYMMISKSITRYKTGQC